MVFSYYLTYPFYNLAWTILKLLRRKPRHILYCEDAFDALLYKNVGKYLKEVDIVAKNKAVKAKLQALGYDKVTTMPAFPDTVIMFRNMAWKFPHRKIVKIGFKHGAYNFKRHSKPKYYNMFNLFFLTSEKEIANVRALGVKTQLAAAYPKIDSLYDGSITAESLQQLSDKIGLNPHKKTILFSATWDGSGMSAIDKWYDKIDPLAEKYNLLVTLHDWVSNKYRLPLQENKNVYFINELDRLPYIKLADVCISDTSSMIAEFCLLEKPLITFKIAQTARTLSDVATLIEKISIQINDFEELETAVDSFIKDPSLKATQRKEATKILFDTPDGQAGKRAAERIISIVPELKPFSH